MKNARTIRTMRRHGLDSLEVGFAGFTPNGKYVVKLAKTLKAHYRLEKELVEKFPDYRIAPHLCAGSTGFNVKVMSRFLKAPAPVQFAWG